MLMSAIDRAVDAVPLVVGVLTKCFEHTLPDPVACPAVEAIEHGLPGAKVAGKISPRSACTPPPQYRLHEVAIVPPRPSGAPSWARRARAWARATNLGLPTKTGPTTPHGPSG